MQITLDDHNSPKSYFTIINAYSPHSGWINKKPVKIDDFYANMSDVYYNYENSTLILIAGELSEKVGNRFTIEEAFIGRHGRGERNIVGTLLASFCQTNNLFLCNTAFMYSARHMTTWSGNRTKSDGSIAKIYNQIDYIICRQKDRSIVTDARAYGGSVIDSNHKMVIAKMSLK